MGSVLGVGEDCRASCGQHEAEKVGWSCELKTNKVGRGRVMGGRGGCGVGFEVGLGFGVG